MSEVENTDWRNAETSRQEVAEIQAERPLRIFGYCPSVGRGASITTWTGDAYGRITSVGPLFRSNFGGRRQNFRCLIFGAEYSGTAYPDSGDYVRLRRMGR